MIYLKPYCNDSRACINEFDTLDRIFQGFLEPYSNKNLSKHNINEDKDSYTITAELPGYKKEDISIEVKDKILHIHAKNDDRHTEQHLRIGDLNLKKSNATLEHGILTIHLAKSEKQKAHKIELQ